MLRMSKVPNRQLREQATGSCPALPLRLLSWGRVRWKGSSIHALGRPETKAAFRSSTLPRANGWSPSEAQQSAASPAPRLAVSVGVAGQIPERRPPGSIWVGTHGIKINYSYRLNRGTERVKFNGLCAQPGHVPLQRLRGQFLPLFPNHAPAAIQQAKAQYGRARPLLIPQCPRQTPSDFECEWFCGLEGDLEVSDACVVSMWRIPSNGVSCAILRQHSEPS